MMSSPETARSMLSEALDYLRLKYPIFPVCSPLMGMHQHRIDGRLKDCAPDKRGKNPMTSWKAYQDRLPTEQEVRQWWTRWPTANIGMATGKLSGIIVLDCDSGEARQLALDKGGLEKTPAVWTGTPGGIHFWMQHPGYEVKNFVKDIPGTDFRGDGGYILLPPSKHYRGATYRWAESTIGRKPACVPEWLHTLFQSASAPAGDSDSGDPISLDDILSGIDEGARDTTLWRYASKMRGDDIPQDYAEQQIRMAARLCRPPFDEGAAVEKVRRAYREFKPRKDFDWFEDPDELSAAEASAPAAPKVFLLPISEWLAMPEVEPDWLVDQLFTVGSSGWVAAEPKVGKSWTVLELVYALSTGTAFLNRFVVKKPRRVIYIQEEDSPVRVVRRLKQLLRGDPIRTPPSDDYLRCGVRAGFKIDNDTWIARLCVELDSFPAEVVVLDVFNRLHIRDENKQAEMSAVLDVLTNLTRRYGCAFIVVHHNKKSQPGAEVRPNQMLRGSGVLGGWSECALYLRKGKEKHVFIVTPESKDAPEMDDFSITLRDTENGGVVLDIGSVSFQDRTQGLDTAIVAAVERIENDGLDATAQRIADVLGKDRSTVQKRLPGIVETGELVCDEIQIGRGKTKIYSIPTL